MPDMSEFSIPFQADKLGPKPKKIHIEASKEECADLRDLFELTDLSALKGQVMLERLSGKKIQADFKVSCKVSQICVVSEKRLNFKHELSFKRIYDGSNSTKDEEKEIEIDLEAREELDPIIDGVIDLGAAISEELGLEIDPFPRADNTEFVEFGIGPEITEEEVQNANPFAVLKGLQNKND